MQVHRDDSPLARRNGDVSVLRRALQINVDTIIWCLVAAVVAHAQHVVHHRPLPVQPWEGLIEQLYRLVAIILGNDLQTRRLLG
ncbi:hypothetical protein LMG919_19495 [Xanthomonas vesicatoria]|nr:hypothetical protein LMG919_19495 [Xanthomonas vesicatoria]